MVYKICKNILICDISHKTFIKTYDGIRYLVILGHSWFDKICDNIKYFISEKSGITDTINHNVARIIIDSYNSKPIE